MRYLTACLALIILSAPIGAQETLCPFTATASRGGYYRVLIDGAEISQHTRIDQAMERAARAETASPSAETLIDHDFSLRIECPTGATEDPTDPEPDPEPSPSPAGPTLDSDWDAALGTSDAALTDGGQWGGFTGCGGGRSRVLEVVDAEPLGLPGHNALQIKSRGESCGAVLANPVADVGQDTWGRMYVTVDDQSSRSWNHPIAYDYVGDINLSFGISPRGNGTWEFRVNGDHETLGDIDNFWPSEDGVSAYGFPTGQWYRIEWHIDLLDSTGRYRMEWRVYDDSGALLFDESDFWDTGWSRSHNIADLNAAGDWLTSGSDPLAEWQEFGVGSEGPFSHPDDGGSYYLAAVAISTEGWVGSTGGPF